MEQISQYKKVFFRDGFLKVKKVYNKNEIKQILSEIDNIKRKFLKIKNPNMHYTKDKGINTIHDINKFIKKGFLIKLSKDKRLINIIEKIMGGRADLRNIEFFLKPRKTGIIAPAHQDNIFYNIPNKKVVNVWIACTTSNFMNGGVYYLLKSHKDGLFNHEMSYMPGTSQQIPQKYLKKIKYKKYFPNLNPGDCIFHHCEVIHGSNKNRSNKDRVGLVLSYKSKKAKVDKKGWRIYQKNLEISLKFLKKIH